MRLALVSWPRCQHQPKQHFPEVRTKSGEVRGTRGHRMQSSLGRRGWSCWGGDRTNAGISEGPVSRTSMEVPPSLVSSRCLAWAALGEPLCAIIPGCWSLRWSRAAAQRGRWDGGTGHSIPVPAGTESCGSAGDTYMRKRPNNSFPWRRSWHFAQGVRCCRALTLGGWGLLENTV